MSDSYYSRSLAAERLRRCYEIAPPRVQQYLAAEIEFARTFAAPKSAVLELGCGYGRILSRLVTQPARLVGIDTSATSLALARTLLPGPTLCELYEMNAVTLAFEPETFDLVLCLQNGISAFHVDQRELVTEAVRVTRPSGTLLWSSYSPSFWDHRLHWFALQAEQGLVGEIDYQATGNGRIVCRDGFTATTVTAGEFRQLASGLPVDCQIREIDHSSIFCIMTKQ